MSTKNDLLAAWVKLTGEPVEVVRHRIRVLSGAGLLPMRADPMTYTDLARWLIGVSAPDSHLVAVETVRRFAEFRCVHPQPGSDEQLTSGSLLEALERALQHPFKIVAIDVYQMGNDVTLWARVGDDQASTRAYYFSGVGLGLGETIYPVMTTKSIHFGLISRLTAELMPKTENGASLPGEAPPSDRPVDEGIAATKTTSPPRKRSGSGQSPQYQSGDTAAMPSSAGEQPPTEEYHDADHQRQMAFKRRNIRKAA